MTPYPHHGKLSSIDQFSGSVALGPLLFLTVFLFIPHRREIILHLSLSFWKMLFKSSSIAGPENPVTNKNRSLQENVPWGNRNTIRSFKCREKGQERERTRKTNQPDMEQLFLISAPPLRSACWSL